MSAKRTSANAHFANFFNAASIASIRRETSNVRLSGRALVGHDAEYDRPIGSMNHSAVQSGPLPALLRSLKTMTLDAARTVRDFYGFGAAEATGSFLVHEFGCAASLVGQAVFPPAMVGRGPHIASSDHASPRCEGERRPSAGDSNVVKFVARYRGGRSAERDVGDCNLYFPTISDARNFQP